MCGIFAYAGTENAVPFLIDGLRSVEYRGYDSAGIAVIGGDGKIQIARRGDHKASLENLAATVGKGHLPGVASGMAGLVGIGHTRWATHGEVNQKNAHPHSSSDGLVAIAHNGIIENFLELKDELVDSGIEFKSDTDSEVFAHLVGRGVANGSSLRESVVGAARRIKGNAAVVALSALEPDTVVGLRVGNAGGIVIGTSAKTDASVMASDTIALLPFTNEVIYLEPGEIVEIERGVIRLFDLEGTPIDREPVRVNQNFEAAKKGKYPDFMSKEIAEQPDAIQGALRGRADFAAGTLDLPEITLTRDQINAIDRVVLTGMGTSLHAGMFGASVIESLTRIPAVAENSSELRYRNPVLGPNTLVVAVTQSGETADTLAAMEQARQAGSPQVVVLEMEGSQATRIADFTLPVRAGQEIGVASTKTMIASMTTLLELAVFLAQSRGAIDSEQVKKIVEMLAELPSLVASVLDIDGKITSLAERLSGFSDLLYLGRGAQLPIALEGALKMKELAYIHAEGYAAGEMKHGVNALLGPEMATVVCAPKNDLYEKMLSNISEVKARGSEVAAIATEGDNTVGRLADHVIHVPDCPGLLQPFLTVVPLQMLAYRTALVLGRDPDKPRNLAKTVTVE
ncbi:MAG: glutamine--fructose-6-phosphate transaminase (isomerizing) [Chloroflexi bacterium]|nr:glutamine--fructose-6-phosphate transaminase (isomerizing) [Chloroflexota bacterium]MCI0870295.1 glutamine--fructose-6-phosphate transaminase (isomerizing) [Chloroflexota bacterium]MCI0881792.1 glutamine--fructose-6-phosphate transaminase (isomerizing) [Chloroflexota bacterium]